MAETPADPPGEAESHKSQNPAADSTAGPSIPANQQQILEEFVARMQTVTPTEAAALTSRFVQDTNRAAQAAAQARLDQAAEEQRKALERAATQKAVEGTALLCSWLHSMLVCLSAPCRGLETG